MIAFATLFLGLVVGVHAVEVVVGDEVAEVELLLDGNRVATISGEPWTFVCNFGVELVPQRLEAVAYDEAGRELGRALQLVNLPRAPAQVSAAVLDEAETGASFARLSWESKVGAAPLAVSAWFDGAPLAVSDPRRIRLPPREDGRFHLFNAELEFEENVVSQVMVTFGGLFGEQVYSELTAIPVLAADAGRRRPPSIESLRGRLSKNGEPLEVVSVEGGRSEVIIVLGKTMNDFGDRLVARTGLEARTAVALRHDLSVRFMSPASRTSRGVETLFNLYPLSPELRKENGGLYWLLTRTTLDAGGEAERRVADAVAVAGLAAYERQRRRAVVLLAGSGMEDESLYTPELARRYLERLRVPLFVWTKKRNPEPLEGWGLPASVASLDELRDAFDEVARALDRQWIVWLKGRHLPQEIELAPGSDGLTLALSP